MKYSIYAIPAAFLLVSCSTINPYTAPPASCDGIFAEMDAHSARIARVGRLGQIRDVGVGLGTIALLGGFVTGAAAAFTGAVTTAATQADVDTTGNKKRRELLWDLAATRGCW